MTQRFEELPTMDKPTIELIPMDKDVVSLLHRILDQNSEIVKINLAILEYLPGSLPPLFKGDFNSSFRGILK